MKLILGNPRWLEFEFNAEAFRIAIKHHLCEHKCAAKRSELKPKTKPHHRHSAFLELP